MWVLLPLPLVEGQTAMTRDELRMLGNCYRIDRALARLVTRLRSYRSTYTCACVCARGWIQIFSIGECGNRVTA